MSAEIRHLAHLAYERELHQALSRVRAHLELWRPRENRFFKVDDLRSRFLSETADEVWRIYDCLPPEQSVGRAMRLGLLAREEIPAEVAAAVVRVAGAASE